MAAYDFELPPELIAQRPLAARDESRLMVLERGQGLVAQESFRDIAARFSSGDLLVLNDTRVFPARLYGHKSSGGRVEVLLVRELAEAGVWEVMARSSKPLRAGQRLVFPGGLEGEVLSGGEDVIRRLRFSSPAQVLAVAEVFGRIPLPPYIRREADGEDRERYQTVFSRTPGSVAAPTAGLHFTPALLEELRRRGVRQAHLTLHVGPGTFLPVRDGHLSEHRMHRECYVIPEQTADEINRARAEGRRVVAVGTTTTRALESAVDAAGRVAAGAGETELFIRPGFPFRAIDALVTNFHLPRSTLLMLVAAFAGYEPTLAAYRQAVAARYRFFSYGDCMLVL